MTMLLNGVLTEIAPLMGDAGIHVYERSQCLYMAFECVLRQAGKELELKFKIVSYYLFSILGYQIFYIATRPLYYSILMWECWKRPHSSHKFEKREHSQCNRNTHTG